MKSCMWWRSILPVANFKGTFISGSLPCLVSFLTINFWPKLEFHSAEWKYGFQRWLKLSMPNNILYLHIHIELNPIPLCVLCQLPDSVRKLQLSLNWTALTPTSLECNPVVCACNSCLDLCSEFLHTPPAFSILPPVLIFAKQIEEECWEISIWEKSIKREELWN